MHPTECTEAPKKEEEEAKEIAAVNWMQLGKTWTEKNICHVFKPNKSLLKMVT